MVEGLAEHQIESSRGLFKTRLPAAKEDAAARTARLKLYVEAASLIPENAEALELLREAEELHKDLKWPERKEAVAQMYEDFLHAAPDTTQAYEVLKRILSALGREDPATLARCESIMAATGTPREQRRLFYRELAPTIRSWKLLGYFDPGAGKRNLEKEMRPERFPVRLNASYADADGAATTWRDAECSWHSLDLWDHLPTGRRGYPVAYAYTRVESPRTQKACLAIGVSHGCVVWVNGERAGPAVWRGFRRDGHYVPIQLREGLNDLLVKVIHSSARGQLSCRIADQNGRPLDGIVLSLPVNVVSVIGSADPDRVSVMFSEPVDRASAEALPNYAVSGDVTVTGASLGADWRTLTLSTSPLVRTGEYTLTVGGVTSAESPLRGVERGSKRQFVILGSGGGLTGRYYNELEFKKLAVTRTDPVVNFAWGEGAPAGVEPGDLSVVWTGFVEPLFSEEYTFHTLSDDGVRLWVGGRKLVDNWTNHGVVENSGKIRLEAFKRYEIRIEYFQGWGDSCIKLLWSSRSQNREIVPRTQLYPETPEEGGPAGVPTDGGTQPAGLGPYPGNAPAGTGAREAWLRILARIQLTGSPRGSYRFEVQFTRIRGDCMAVMFPVHDTSGLLVVSGWEGKVSGLAFIDGKDANANGTTRNGKLSNGEKHTLLLEVRAQRNARARVAVSLDGEAYLTWRGRTSSLKPNRAWGLRQAGSLGIGAYNATIVFHSCRLQALGDAGAR
ncbi:MAG: PA14 domain-containing protein [Planctomycetota bacterium]